MFKNKFYDSSVSIQNLTEMIKEITALHLCWRPQCIVKLAHQPASSIIFVSDESTDVTNRKVNLIQFYSYRDKSHQHLPQPMICKFANRLHATPLPHTLLTASPPKPNQHQGKVVVTYPAHHHAGWLFKDWFLCCSNVSSKQQDRHKGGTTVISFRERYQRSFSTPFQMRWSKGKRSKEIKELVSFKSGPFLLQGHLLVRLRATLRVAAVFKKLCGSTLD